MSGNSSVSAFPEGDNLFSWVAQITGGSGTLYEGLKYKLSLSFPSRYPYAPPTVKFVTPCYHPNVDKHGNICLDILKEKWSALYDVRTILLSIQSLLAEPNNDSPLNVEAAELWDNQSGEGVEIKGGGYQMGLFKGDSPSPPPTPLFAPRMHPKTYICPFLNKSCYRPQAPIFMTY